MSLPRSILGDRRFSSLSRLSVLLMPFLALVASLASETPAPSSPMKSYVIIFRQGPFSFTAEVSARRQQEIVAWATRHQITGHRLDPRALDPEVRRPGVRAPEDAVAWPVVALVFLEARDIDEAAAIAADHPAKNYNVSTEVRPWSARKVPDSKP